MEKNRIVSIFLAAVLAIGLCLPAAAAGGTFSDVSPDAWYADAVDYAVENGLFSGISSTTFSPTGDMTRGMFVTVLSRVAGADTASAADAGFTDVSDGIWYEDAVNWAAENEYVNGVGNNKFSPDTPITREQIAVVMYNYLSKTDTELDKVSNPVTFKDADKVSSWAVDGVEFMRTTGLMAGDNNNNFNPAGQLTRAEAATVFMRLDKTIQGENPSNPTPPSTSDDDKPVAGDPVATLPGNVTVYEEPVSVNDAYSTVVKGDVGEPTPGKSSEGLIEAGTERANGTVVEQQVYVQVSDNITGIMTTEYHPTEMMRMTSLDVYAYPGDTFVVDAKALGFESAGEWQTNQKDQISISKIDTYTARVTVNEGGVAGLMYYNSDENIHHIRSIAITAFNRRPAQGETADFTMTTQYDTTYHIGKDKDNKYTAWVWLTEKGQNFDKNTATLVTKYGAIVDRIHVYPSADMNVAKSDLTDEGYIDPVAVIKYFIITTDEVETNFLRLGDSLSIGFFPLQSANDNQTVTVTLTSRETGLSKSIDFTLIYTE